jgi:hypothetical protein
MLPFNGKRENSIKGFLFANDWGWLMSGESKLERELGLAVALVMAQL